MKHHAFLILTITFRYYQRKEISLTLLILNMPDTARYGHMKNWNYHRGVYERQINDRLMISEEKNQLGAELVLA